MENEPTGGPAEEEPYHYTIEQLTKHLDRIDADLDRCDDVDSVVRMRREMLLEEKGETIHQINLLKEDYGEIPRPPEET